MTVIEMLLILIVTGGVLWYVRHYTTTHKHKWQYMFSAGNSNEYNWFYCPGCMAQSVARMNKDGAIEIEVYDLKKPWRPKK
jgi:hypothetical protein